MTTTILLATLLLFGQGDASKQAPAPKPTDPWRQFRKRIADRLAKDQNRLRNLLDRSYLSDLSLDYSDPDNRGYLRRKIDELAKKDPDLGGLLIDFLDPKGGGSAMRHRAENSLRVLALMDLHPYETRLRTLLEKGGLSARLRALDLLSRMPAPGLTPIIGRYLSETPEIQLPRVLACAGRYGDASLAPKLLPFLGRPNAQQRLDALRALARLGAAAALEEATKAATSLDSEASMQALLALLAAVAPKLGDARSGAFTDACLAVLGKASELGKADVIAALRLLAGQPPAWIARHLAKIRPMLVALLDHRYPAVQFDAAKLLRSQGDKSAIKQVLDRLNSFVKKNRKVPYAYYQRARAFAAFGKTSEALRDLGQAIKYSNGPDPSLHFFAARLEIERGNAGQVARHLKEAAPTAAELAKFRRDNPGVEALIKKSRTLRRLFQT